MQNTNKISKKLFFVLICATLITITAIIFCSCSKTDKIKIGTTYDYTAVALCDMFENKNDYSVTTLIDPEDLLKQIDSGALDVALIPTNYAASLYNKEHNVKVCSINNYCSSFAVSQDTSIKTADDITNQKIYSSGENNITGAIVGMLSKSVNFNNKNANIIYKKTDEEVMSNISADPKALGIVNQPLASYTARANNNINKVIDVEDQWHKIFGNNNNPVSTVTIARTDFIDKYKAKFEKFLEDEKASINSANENSAQAAYTVNKAMNNSNYSYDAKDIESCKLIYIDGSQMQNEINAFLKMVYEYDPSMIGNIIPDNNFYYIK